MKPLLCRQASRLLTRRVASIFRTCWPLDVNQKFKVITSDQTTHNIHPLAQSDDRQHPVEQVSAAGSAANR